MARSKVNPIEIKRGSVTVKIYPGKNRVGGRSYPQFTLIYWLDGKRVRQRFAQLKAARREAERVATAQANGEHAVLRLTSSDQAIFLQACEQLRPLNIPLNLAVADYVGAVKGMPEGTSLKEAVDFFKRRNPVRFPQKPVRLTDDVNRIRQESNDDKTPPFQWKHNGLRHGFCSYRLAILKDVAQVSLEAGNSPQMIFANYRKVVAETSAQDWFSIAP